MIYPETCGDCGNRNHLFGWQCPYDLHGEKDAFKTSCAVCETVIPSGGERVADSYSNLYCDTECKAEGLETLLSKVTDSNPNSAASV